jgi:hypothetical protein
LVLPARSPNLNAFAERWVRSIKSKCLSKLILFGEGSLSRAATEFIEHYHLERPHQGKGNLTRISSYRGLDFCGQVKDGLGSLRTWLGIGLQALAMGITLRTCGLGV